MSYGIIIPLILFLIAFLPRVVSLSTTTTADQQLWITRSLQFFNATAQLDWANTFQTAHPGVTTMWLSGISLGLFCTEGMDSVEQLFIARLPIALMTSIGVLLIYYFIKKIFNSNIAILSALFVALDPFYLAHSKVIHLDAMLTTFMTLSVLSLLVHLNNPNEKRYLIFTGIFSGLAILTKLPAIFLIPFIPFTVFVWNLFRTFNSTGYIRYYFNKKNFLIFINTILIIGVISVVTYSILWPVIWVEPLTTINKLFENMQYVRAVPHGSGFFMGEISKGGYGISFYPVILLMRSTPVTLIFSMVCFVYLVINTKINGFTKRNKNILILILYVILFVVQMALSAKQGDRYLLPVFPVLDILAAIGLYFVANITTERLPSLIDEYVHIKTNHFRTVLPTVIFVVAILLQASSSLPLHPYYLSYYNPIVFGGPSHAPEITTVGWGEGMDMAARYLNGKPNSQNLTVAVQYTGFEEYFKGRTVEMNHISSSDYIVFYICAIQRDWNKDIWEQYKNENPEKIIIINNINYCWIYKTNVGKDK